MSLGIETEHDTEARRPANIPDGARVLIVCEDDSDARRLRALLLDAGFDPDRAKSITAGCDAALSGKFQVVISAPHLRDGSWKQLTGMANRYNLHYEVVLWAHNFDLREWASAINDGAFEVLDALDEQQKTVEATKCAVWSAYLNGAGPSARAVPPYHVA